MRFSVLAVLAAVSSVAVAQLTALPKCAQDCFGGNLGGCKDGDFKCVCSNSDLIASLSCCVAQKCSPTEQESTIKLAVGLCAAYQVTVPTSASCPASQSAASTASPSGTGAVSSGVASITSSAASRASSAASVASSAAAAASSAASRASGAAGSTGAAPVQTAGAGILGFAIAGMLAAL
ncbi:hypothetical protein BCR34DRAFT_117052 [Clohesyomyces aquaticus]|uniref:CFEM domain-containing protein n=1 Tax=Clohesyomyces aquaticus TaxID=1231657 RepID=A0A1Y1YR19_9PLEO|nr:hypothetical protein BCR34DRAFT_117052 [Clohesyomyces aquaticus]